MTKLPECAGVALGVAGITTAPAANRYLTERFLAAYDARFAHELFRRALVERDEIAWEAGW